jgi:uncharacterized membrane protein YraQ (UPF0718 family)
MKIKFNKNLFLILVLFIYLIVAFFDFNFIKQALVNSSLIFYKILPILLLVFLVLIFINRFLDTEKIKKHLGEEAGVKGWLWAILLGILISGPPYVLYPLLGELKKKGMTNSLIAVFLYNRNVKIPFIPALIYYFGLGYTIVLSLYIIFFSVLNGLLIGLISKRDEKLNNNK